MIQQHVDSSGRLFSCDEINLICLTAKTFAGLSLTELSKTLCELLEWKRPNGKLKHEECRALLEHLQSAGLIFLPKLRATAAAGLRRVIPTAQSDAQTPVTGSAGQFEPLSLHLIHASNGEPIDARII
jgi:hypothetical protein